MVGGVILLRIKYPGEKVFIKSPMGKCKIFSARKLIKEFPRKNCTIGTLEQKTLSAVCESCEQPQSQSLQCFFFRKRHQAIK